jgi:hypothetical protein
VIELNLQFVIVQQEPFQILINNIAMSVTKAVKYVLLISTYAISVQVCEKANQSAYVPVVFSRQIRKIVCNVRFSVRSAS